MEPIVYINRSSGKHEIERVYGAAALKLIYGSNLISKLFGNPLLHVLVKNPIFSALYGFMQRLPSSKRKIRPFIEAFNVDPSEFLKSIHSFTSFDDFFTRELKSGARPICAMESTAIMPADGRYLFYQDINKADGFVVKGEKFDLATLLEDQSMARRYAHGSMIMARLCPTDYHRFHFPCDCIPSESRIINGWLYSVNPIAIKKDIDIFTKNKRAITELMTEHFGKILFLEIGATNVGSIHQTYIPGKHYPKGSEKGYFSFGASSLILLFEPGRITLDGDLLSATSQRLELKCLMGQSLGKKK